MKVACFSFSKNGGSVCDQLVGALSQKEGMTCEGYALRKYNGGYSHVKPMDDLQPKWIEEYFAAWDALVFIGATGIAVRMVAPFIKSKLTDPAVIAIDEQKKFVIPLLSGHIGGANKLALVIADLLEAIPVITTATDLQKKFAVDQWAAENGLYIANPQNLKAIAAGILNDEEIGLCCDFPMENQIPVGISPGTSQVIGISISADGLKNPYPLTLRLIPECVTVGIGCRKNVSLNAVEALLIDTLAAHHIAMEAVKGLATIDIKKDEQALLAVCEKYNLKIAFYSAEDLQKTEGSFTASPFVLQTTGVDNVCERAAVLSSGNGQLICRKKALDGVTIALAQTNYKVMWPI